MLENLPYYNEKENGLFSSEVEFELGVESLKSKASRASLLLFSNNLLSREKLGCQTAKPFSNNKVSFHPLSKGRNEL